MTGVVFAVVALLSFVCHNKAGTVSQRLDNRAGFSDGSFPRLYAVL